MKRALVIDSSVFARRNFTTVLEKAGYAVSTANGGRSGLKQAESSNPDLVTLDMGIADMAGLQCLEQMTAQKWRPIVVTAEPGEHSAALSQAVRVHGAAAAVQKPSAWDVVHDDQVINDLLRTIRQASNTKPPTRSRLMEATRVDTASSAPGGGRPATAGARPSPARPGAPGAPGRPAAAAATRPTTRPAAGPNFPVFVVGSSTGGPNALHYILTRLPADFPGAIVIAQHMPKRFTSAFATRMDNAMQFPAQEVTGPTEIKPGNCYVATGGSDCVFKGRGGRITIAPEPPLEGSLWVPSVDRLVETALAAVPIKRLRGVQLTGIGNDGAKAMAELHKRGGPTIAESKESSVVFGMPGNLIAMGGATKVLHHHDIANGMVKFL